MARLASSSTPPKRPTGSLSRAISKKLENNVYLYIINSMQVFNFDEYYYPVTEVRMIIYIDKEVEIWVFNICVVFLLFK